MDTESKKTSRIKVSRKTSASKEKLILKVKQTISFLAKESGVPFNEVTSGVSLRNVTVKGKTYELENTPENIKTVHSLKASGVAR